MANRVHISSQGHLREEDDEVVDLPPTSETGEKLKADIDDLLDEVDAVIEEQGADFAANYRQKGGQ